MPEQASAMDRPDPGNLTDLQILKNLPDPVSAMIQQDPENMPGLQRLQGLPDGKNVNKMVQY